MRTCSKETRAAWRVEVKIQGLGTIEDIRLLGGAGDLRLGHKGEQLGGRTRDVALPQVI